MTTQIYEYLLEKIQSCEYPPGEEINEKTLMEDTGFGRTPLREALHALQRDGLVEIFPRKGMRISPITTSTRIRKSVRPTRNHPGFEL